MRPTRALDRVLSRATMLVLATSLVVTLTWVILTMVVRPLDGVEGDVFFEADRIRAGLPLYTDPRSGAYEYGSPPARYLVLYPPLWSAALSLFPRAAAMTAGRLVASVAWFGVLTLLIWRAPSARRRVVMAVGAFVAGIWVLALYGANARPDAVAVLASGIALERVARLASKRADATLRGPASIDVASGVLFALAAWTKPNVLGAAPGAFLTCFAVARGGVGARLRSVAPGIAGIACTSLIVGGALHIVSDGAWLEHLLASTGQPPSATLWLEQIADRGPFFLMPLVATATLGLRASRACASDRDPGAAIATGALVSSTAWALLSLSKIGSASNYFMEPCVAMLVVLSRVDVPRLTPRGHLAAAALCGAQAIWNDAGSISGAARAVPAAFARAEALASVRDLCSAPQGSVVLADEPGIELTLNGRVVATPFQTTHLVRRGRFPIDAWLSDVTSPNVACLVMQDDLLERPLDDDRIAHDRFGPPLRAALLARFEPVANRSGYHIYRAIATSSPRTSRGDGVGKRGVP